MEKLTVQDLGMFIGCRFIGKKKGWVHESEEMILCPIDLSSDKFEYIKPILRPLSDMTEDEGLEYVDIVGFWVDGTSEEYKRKKHHVVLESITRESYPRISPNGFKYLISKQFDVFCWIEKGLAIDRTKL